MLRSMAMHSCAAPKRVSELIHDVSILIHRMHALMHTAWLLMIDGGNAPGIGTLARQDPLGGLSHGWTLDGLWMDRGWTVPMG